MIPKITTEQSIWKQAEAHLDKHVYDLRLPAARKAWGRDKTWFTEHETETVRIRRIRQGECQVVDDRIAADDAFEGWAIILHHIRLQNYISSQGVGLYLMAVSPGPGREAGLRAEAIRLVLSFATPRQAEDHDDDDDDNELTHHPYEDEEATLCRALADDDAEEVPSWDRAAAAWEEGDI